MKTIKTLDLWTEQHRDHFELFNGAFFDGLDIKKEILPFDKYKIVKNCNCIITSNTENLPIGNKHNAIVFYKNKKVVRLIVACRDTNIDFAIENALNQVYEGIKLKDFYKSHNVTYKVVDLKQSPVLNEYNLANKYEIDVGSCHTNELLKQMLYGGYTESESKFGHYDNINYLYQKKTKVNYSLQTDEENFKISHEGSFLNSTNTRIIILQLHSEIAIDKQAEIITLVNKDELFECAAILREIYNSNILSEGWTEKSSLAICEFYYKMQPDLFFVAKREGKVVGFTFSYIKPWADGNHLMVEEISVDPNYRKYGTALKLISKVLAAATKKYNITKIEGTTYEDETGAPFKIYKRLGFKKIDDLFLIECDASKLKSWF